MQISRLFIGIKNLPWEYAVGLFVACTRKKYPTTANILCLCSKELHGHLFFYHFPFPVEKNLLTLQRL